MHYSLLISPLTQSAFFKESTDIAVAEVEFMTGVKPAHRKVGTLEFLELDFEGPPQTLSRLSTIAGIFSRTETGLSPLDITPEFGLPRELVFGAKYPGKTNEVLTHLALNIASKLSSTAHGQQATLLDPMAGRGTTLLWATRYGFEADGIEADSKALVDFQREVKKCTKLQRIKHKEDGGQLPHLKKADDGRYSSFDFKTAKARLIHGDSRELHRFLGQKKRYSMLVSDLPYGVQHFAGKERNPLNTLRDAASTWSKALKAGGAMVLIYNAFIPKRSEIVEVFQENNLKLHDESFSHRVSESIKRELVIFTKL
ncbi:MAG: hypothetical protein VX210_08055 [Myxococcota bacterium]|nr:hypothetical protein [Myxococcota bacterium]